MSETEVFDPSAPEGEKSAGAQYVSKKDFKILLLGMVGLVGLFVPIYYIFKGNTEKTVCSFNTNQIYKAISLYANDHDDRFPPVCATDASGKPYIDQTGVPFTWMSDISQLMSAKATFKCPSTKDDEVSFQQGKESGQLIPSSYGMYAPYGGYERSLVENPDTTILFAETSNHGAQETYDPLPYDSKNDGFMIGWSNSNDIANAESASVTRLAFGQTANGLFKEDGKTRHASGIHFITASGEKKYRGPKTALTEIRDRLPAGNWTVPLAKAFKLPKK